MRSLRSRYSMEINKKSLEKVSTCYNINCLNDPVCMLKHTLLSDKAVASNFEQIKFSATAYPNHNIQAFQSAKNSRAAEMPSLDRRMIPKHSVTGSPDRVQSKRESAQRPESSREQGIYISDDNNRQSDSFNPNLATNRITKFGHQSNRSKVVNVMNLELAGGQDSISRRRLEIQQIQLIKQAIEKRKQQRMHQRQKEKQKFRLKCIQLLQRQHVLTSRFRQQSDDECNFRVVKDTLTQLKVAQYDSAQNQQHTSLLNQEKQATTLTEPNKRPSKTSSQFITRKDQILSTTNSTLASSSKSPGKRKRSSSLFARKRSDKMFFGMGEFGSDKVYRKKIQSYLEFLYKINFSNCIYIKLALGEDTQANTSKVKVYVGKGNNSLLVKSLIKRRFWLQLVDAVSDNVTFFWTQSKLKEVHAKQLEYQAPTPQQSQIVKRKMATLKTKRQTPLEKDQNLKIMGKIDSLMVQNHLSQASLRHSIYQKTQFDIITNHLPQNSFIGSKKALFHSLKYYYQICMKVDPFEYIPKTFHVKGVQDQKFKEFMEIAKTQRDKIWILKPGQNTNRGNGISLVYARDIPSKISSRRQVHSNGETRTHIIQSYINRPLLYHNRKFDIRHYMLLTSVNGLLKAFWYQQGYIRTASYHYDLEDITNVYVHLTNDAIQKHSSSYGKYQPGNKLSYTEFQRYLDMNFLGKKWNFQQDVLPKMRQMALDAIKANFLRLDSKRRLCNFEVFGMDFMIDSNFKPWLIEINANPCLEVSCPLLSRIIPGMVEGCLRVGLDPLLPPPCHYPPMRRYELSDNILSNLRFELMFDQKTDGEALRTLFKNCEKPTQWPDQVSDVEDEYQDDGQEVIQLELQ